MAINIEEVLKEIKAPVLGWVNDAVSNVVLNGVQIGVPSNVAYVDRGQTFSQPQTFAAGLVSYSASVDVDAARQAIYNLHEANPSGNDTVGFAVGNWAIGQMKSGNTKNFNAVVGALDYAFHYGSGTVGSLAGVIASPRVLGTGVAQTVAGGFFGVQISAAGRIDYGIGVLAQAPVKSAGTITTSAGIHIENQGLSGITTSYGLRLNAQSGSTNPFAIYSEGGISYHAGNFGIGDNSPDSGLEIGAMSGAGYVTLNEITAPSSPASNKLALYSVDVDGFTKLAAKDSAGTVSLLGAIARKNSTGSTYSRRRLNFIEGTNVTLTLSDDSTDDEIDLTIAAASGGGGGTYEYVLIVDEKSSGTAGGTFTSGAWRTRDLNTEKSDTGSVASVASNQITLAAGTYRAYIRCPIFNCGRNLTRLQNITDTATTLTGSSELGGSASSSESTITGRFTIAATKTFEVQHQCDTTSTTYGFGVNSSLGTETYTRALFVKEP